jgi:hypothetical protein
VSALRISMVLPTLVRAGMEIVAGRLATGLTERGHQVSIACIEQGGPVAGELVAAGVAVDVVPTPGLVTNLRAPALVAWMARRARRARPAFQASCTRCTGCWTRSPGTRTS